MKFGGTSVGSVESILSVKRIVERQTEPVIVVVSALGGITDKLIRTSQMAVEGNIAYQKSFAEIAERHEAMISDILPAGPKRDNLKAAVAELLEELRSIYQGVYLIRDLSPKTQAAIVSYGEPNGLTAASSSRRNSRQGRTASSRNSRTDSSRRLGSSFPR